jgi:hypothetical protein
MKAKNLIRIAFLMISLALALNGFSQSFPSAGYQGGSHGNIKVITWSGAVDDDWSKPGNWCPAAVPGAQDDVVIPATASIMPEVKVAGLSCKSVTLQPGTAVTIKPGYVLTVDGQAVE